MPGSALYNFIVLLFQIFQAKKNFENRTISSWDKPYAKIDQKHAMWNRVKMTDANFFGMDNLRYGGLRLGTLFVCLEWALDLEIQ